MRAWIWLAGLLVGLALAQRGHAQMLGAFGNNSSSTTRGSGASRPGFLGSSFRLRGLFPSFGNLIGTRQSVGVTRIPDPSSPDYLKAFGYRPLR